MDEKQRCQSCAMPLGEGFYGTDADGKISREFCKHCFENGAFLEPDISLKDMVKRSTDHMVRQLGLPQAAAEMLAETYIPQLKRWTK